MTMKRKKILAALLSLSLLLCVGQTAFADPLDLSEKGNTIYVHLDEQTDYVEDIVHTGLQLDLYQVATAEAVSGYETYRLNLNEAYRSVPVRTGVTVEQELANLNQQADPIYDDLADALAAAVLAETSTLTPTASVDAKNGETPIVAEGLNPGMYLLIPHGKAAEGTAITGKNGTGGYVKTVTINQGTSTAKEVYRTRAYSVDYDYTFRPMLVTVPGRLDASGAYVYHTAVETDLESEAPTEAGGWTNEFDINIKVERERNLGDLRIVKTLNHTGPDKASFVFEIRWTDNRGASPTTQIRYATITVNGGGTGGTYTLEKTIPVGTTVTVTEMTSGLQFSPVTVTPQTATIVAASAAGAPATVSFVNDHDAPGGGHGVVNRFTNEHGPYLWTAYEDSNAATSPAFDALIGADGGN